MLTSESRTTNNNYHINNIKQTRTSNNLIMTQQQLVSYDNNNPYTQTIRILNLENMDQADDFDDDG